MRPLTLEAVADGVVGQTTPREKLRWGRILTPEYIDEYSSGSTSSPPPQRRKSLRIVVPRAVSMRQDAIPADTAAAVRSTYRATRQSSLSRSNAVRSSRTSRFSLAGLFARTSGLEGGDTPTSPRPSPGPSGEAVTAETDMAPAATRHSRLVEPESPDDISVAQLSSSAALLTASDLTAAAPADPPSNSPRSGGRVDTDNRTCKDMKPPSRHDATTENTEGADNESKAVETRFARGTVDSKQHVNTEASLEWLPPEKWQERENRLKKRIGELEIALLEARSILSPLMEEVTGRSKADNWEGWTADLEEVVAELRHSKAFVSSFGDITPRAVLLLKLLQHQPGRPSRQTAAERSNPGQSGLDVPIGLDRAVNFSRGLDAGAGALVQNTLVKACAICRVPKFINAPVPSSNSPTSLDEFHPRLGTTACCGRAVCRTCLPKALVSGISKDWWQNLGLPHWLGCPIPSCPATFPIRYNVDLTNLLQSLGDSQALHHVMQFDRANLLRSALEGLGTRPTSEALTKAAQLHDQLVSHGRMRSFFELRHMIPLKIEMLPVDDGRGATLDVPIFTGLFLRRRRSVKGRNKEAAPTPTTFSRDCIVCAESVVDVVDGTPEDEARWAEATAGFPGEWQARVRMFPAPSLIPECGERHATDICRKCIATHIDTQLESLGRAGCDRIACPAADCGHVYTDGELRLLAAPEGFARYDRYRLLNHLATLPNFRWCLREGCESGQIYDMADGPLAWGGAAERSRVSCDACGFDMCFAHQTAWHDGLSCAGFDAQRQHGDHGIEATRAWLAEHTKPCPGPGCGVPVEKKGGCFHMTCATCGFQFCWECLADWNKIAKSAVLGRRAYNRKGHNVGCYFRDGDAVEPTQLMGNRLEDALAGL